MIGTFVEELDLCRSYVSDRKVFIGVRNKGIYVILYCASLEEVKVQIVREYCVG